MNEALALRLLLPLLLLLLLMMAMMAMMMMLMMPVHLVCLELEVLQAGSKVKADTAQAAHKQ